MFSAIRNVADRSLSLVRLLPSFSLRDRQGTKRTVISGFPAKVGEHEDKGFSADRISAVFALTLVININDRAVGDRLDPKIEGKFELYRRVIADAFQIDIKEFKDSLKGGMADGRSVTAYDLEELLTGIKFEMEHTSDRFIALELAMDHLERIPDYYTRLSRLEREFVSDWLLQM